METDRGLDMREAKQRAWKKKRSRFCQAGYVLWIGRVVPAVLTMGIATGEAAAAHNTNLAELVFSAMDLPENVPESVRAEILWMREKLKTLEALSEAEKKKRKKQKIRKWKQSLIYYVRRLIFMLCFWRYFRLCVFRSVL